MADSLTKYYVLIAGLACVRTAARLGRHNGLFMNLHGKMENLFQSNLSRCFYLSAVRLSVRARAPKTCPPIWLAR